VVGLLVIKAFDGIWKEVTVAKLRILFRQFCGRTEDKKKSYSMEQSPNRLLASQEIPPVL
jgi:hypothetical protein